MEDKVSPAGSFASLIPILLWSVVSAIVAFMLAKEKGRNVKLWTFLGAIPLINFVFLYFFVGAANLRLEEKIDKLSKLLHQSDV